MRRVSEEIGDGVFATRAIPRGTIVWTQDVLDSVYPAAALGSFTPPILKLLEHFAHIDEKGQFVLCWDAGKLVNHSCTPTLRGVGTWLQIARRDIAPGEEITCDYAECNIQSQLDCRCGQNGCRGRVHANDLLTYADSWDAEAEELLRMLSSVDQPLWPYLLDAPQVLSYIEGHATLPSFRELHSVGSADEHP